MKTLEHLNYFPPVLLRVFARSESRGKGVVSLSNREIAIMSGLPLAKVERLSALHSWSGVTFGDMVSFFDGCRFNPMDNTHRNRLFAYLNSNGGSPQYQFVKRSAHYESELLPLLSNPKVQDVIKSSILALKKHSNKKCQE